MTTYKAIATRDGKWWMVSIPAIDGLTQARRLSEATAMASEYIAAAQDIPLHAVKIDLSFSDIDAINDVTERVNAVTKAREQATQLEREATAAATALARDLASAHVPLRDIGTILGVSHQRAHQLTTSH